MLGFVYFLVSLTISLSLAFVVERCLGPMIAQVRNAVRPTHDVLTSKAMN